ncbi:Hypothetical protein LUCI_2876 [Lucifera butyrica]|uniref:2Fe-2S ferredoxin-type domain-containing protein n=1 Tax=Lucifera butyrica TaxID=1351585 RepID=A0A498R895_9FIRM|nr:ASKHA domain-containing protein [Lucifera butyrica]VBB07611.1 Hypothetical protein LUCI_2876 [Lucifera butyrica]
MLYKIRIHRQSQIEELQAEEGSNLLQTLLQHNYDMYAPCNGNGTCGKCKIRLIDPAGPEPTSKGHTILSTEEITAGYRLACRTTINSDLDIRLDDTDFLKAKVVTEGRRRKVRLSPAVSKRFITLTPPDLEDQRSDSRRLADTLGLKQETASLSLLRQLPATLRAANFETTLLFNRTRLAGLEAGNTTAKLFGIAVDIGTTTLAAYLLNLNTGDQLATYSGLNPQKKFGADVIARISHTLEKPNGLAEMQAAILEGINQAVRQLTAAAGLQPTDVYEIVLVGNTTMLHFLLNLAAKNMAASPFIPVTTQTFILQAAEAGITINQNAIVVLVPAVAAYIGADTVAAALASGMSTRKPVSLLIDFGTNGEIVLGNSEWLLACSAAAGPAFEGANIHNGVGSIPGAIDSFLIEKELKYTTIGGEKPVGICGTGLIDIAAGLYKAGIIDATGRMATGTGLPNLPQSLKDRLAVIDGMAAFLIASADESAHHQEVYITQKDIRELQNAKAAIAAGIQVLAATAGIRLQDIEKTYLAGGFGSYIKAASAIHIGLIPLELSGRLEAIGNAAGAGAVEILLSRRSLHQAEKIKQKIKYIELSSCREFNDFFIDAMLFTEE